MALAEGEVVGIVRGRDFDRAGAEVAADPLVENDGNLAVHQRQAQLLAVQMQVALVFRMNGDGDVAEHGLGARGGDGEKLASIFAVSRRGPGTESPRGGPFARRGRLQDR